MHNSIDQSHKDCGLMSEKSRMNEERSIFQLTEREKSGIMDCVGEMV